MAQAFINLYMVQRQREAAMKWRKVKRRLLRDLSNPFELYESEFHDLFRISREMARDICVELNDDLAPRKSFGVSVVVKVLTAIRVLAVGSYQRTTGQDYLLVLGQTTVSKFLRQFTVLFLRKFLRKYIQFPAFHRSRELVAQGFYEKFGFPNILGCIDCTHVVISTPFANHEAYLNHYGDHSLNVQLVCDVDGKILNVNARYPGRVHDQFIFNNSLLNNEMLRLYNNRIGDYHLIGDSGYTLEPWMMTPITRAVEGSREYNYTQKICQIRNIIERVNGIVKATWRCVKKERVLNYQPVMANRIIMTSCVLYNMMKHYRVPFPPPEPDEHDVMEDVMNAPAPDDGRFLNIARQKRQRFVEQL